MPANNQDYDVAIIGGGMVGASLALALRDSGLRIAVIEKFSPRVSGDAPKASGYDDRTLVLNPVSCNLMQQLGLQQLIDNAVPIEYIHVSDKGRFGRAQLRAADYQLDCFGKVVEAHRLGFGLLNAVMQGCDTVDWLTPAQLTDIERLQDCCILTLDNEQPQISAKLIVGADGGSSRVREIIGLPAYVHDYQQTAITCNATPSRAHAGRAFERFTSEGPIAVLPQPEQRVGVVMICSSDQAEKQLSQSDEAFLETLQSGFGYRLGWFKKVGQRSSYPLRLIRAEANVADRCILLGNASHSIHPVSAQGFNLGLRDVYGFARVLMARDPETTDIGDQVFLQQFQQQRQADQDNTIRYTDTLARLYTNPSAIAGILRGTGLLAHQFVPALQRKLVNSAMGYR